jgi:long-subunit fatty acid transport protein
LLAGGASSYGQVVDPPRQEEVELQRSNVVLGSGARALGMGGAFLARADDATAASWNPAGLSYLRRPEVSVVGFLSSRTTTGRSPLGESTSTDTFDGRALDFVSLAHPLQLGGQFGAVQLSYQRLLPFGGDRHIEIPESRATRVFDLSLHGGFDVVALGTGLVVWQRLRLGVTVNRWFNGFEQETTRSQRFQARTVAQTVQRTEFDLSGWNANAGVIWTPVEALNLGAVFKTPFTASVQLSRSRSDFFADVPSPETTTKNEFSTDDVRLEFPWALGLGMSVRPRSALTISADYTRTAWSDARIQRYFLLERTSLGEPAPTPAASNTVSTNLPYPTLDLENQQSDTEQIRVGVEWVLIGARFKVPLRAGYFTDQQFFRDRTSSAPVFTGFTLGTGVVTGDFLLDLAYVFEWGDYEDIESVSNVSARASGFWISLIYRPGS